MPDPTIPNGAPMTPDQAQFWASAMTNMAIDLFSESYTGQNMDLSEDTYQTALVLSHEAEELASWYR